ncbi:MAG: PSP1 domain-containing protein [Chitinophagaceae bacterium]
MGCGSCGTGKPNGCKSNGGCSTGGCNRLNVHDWLRNLPFSDPESSCKVVEISFKQGSRKEFYRNPTFEYFEKGQFVTVEGVNGFDVGQVSLSGELVRLQMKKAGVKEDDPEMKKILRLSTERDLELYHINKDREPSVQAKSREFARNLKLQMKLSEVEIQADGKKGTFFYTADDRVDFRELIRFFAGEFKLKVEMKQIGIRQEAAKVGGIGSCGRELCCSTWLHDFKSVNTTAARYQNLSINQTKLSGQCGRLKCCLNYELDTYLDALQHFPDNADTIEIARGPAFLIKKDIFKNLMWYTVQGSTKHYPLTIERVKEIKQLNAKGIRPDELEAVEVVSNKQKESAPEFVELVGQISLKTLEKNDRRRRDQQRSRQQDDRPKQQDNNRREPQQNTNRPPQQRPPQNVQQKNIAPEKRVQQVGGNNKPPQQQKPPQQKPPQNVQQKKVEPEKSEPLAGEGNNNQEQKPPQQQKPNGGKPHRRR